jgi:DNA polymerase III epsilon subunit-like protein
MLQSEARMPPYSNLVSDSTLVQDTIDLLTCSGGRAAASEIVDAVFKLSHIDDELAGLLVADLIRNDRRFKIIENNTVELLQDDSQSRLLKDLDFVVVDVEATGAKTPPNRLIELGAYRIRGGRIVDKFLSLVNPEIPIPRFVASLTGISNEMVKRAPVFADVAPQWLDFVSDSVLVAHNAPFDTSFLNHEISRVYPGHRMVNPHLCTVRLSRRALPDLSIIGSTRSRVTSRSRLPAGTVRAATRSPPPKSFCSCSPNLKKLTVSKISPPRGIFSSRT